MKGNRIAKSPIVVESPVDGRTVIIPSKESPEFKEFLTGMPTKKDPIAVVPTQPGKFTPFSTNVDPKLTEYVNTMDGKAPVPAPRSASIVPKSTQGNVPTAPPQTPQEESWLSKMFSGSKTEPGEYSTGRNLGTGVVQFLGNFGNSISGNAGANVSLNQAFAKQRQDYMDRDPNSRSSILYRGMAQRMGLPIRGDENAYDLREQMPNVKEFLAAKELGLREKMATMRGQGGSGQAKPLAAEQQKNVSNSAMALTAIRDMRNALKGNNTFSLVGDNDFTEARRRFAEGFGRLQSGGVIGPDELKNYEAMAPKATDSAKQQEDKLRRFEAEIQSRLELSGISPEQIMGRREESSAASQVKFVKDTKTGKTLKVNGLGEVLE